ncbi:MAG: hypothetical protein ABI707_20810 [Ferruginibacter sp.]
MKNILYAAIAIFILTSCKTSKDYLLRSDEDKTLYDIVKKLNKHSDDEEATKALPQVYKQAKERHLKKIAVYSNYKEINRWERIGGEYNILQSMHDAIANSDAASRLVTPAGYQNEISGIKQSAAEDYYRLGETYLDNNSRDYTKKAYDAFKKADGWITDYKNSRAKMDEAFSNGIVTVIINPVQDNSFFFNAGWGNTGYNYSNEYFQQNLVRDLGGKYASRYPAKFYTEREAQRDNVEPDWVINLTLRNMDIPRPSIYNYSRDISKKIEIGRDTSGKPFYKTVYATLNIQRQFFNARAQMEINITDIHTRKNIAYNTFTDTYNWREEVATFSGDRRALSNNDWTLINNSNFNLPGREDILNRLYRNIYPQVKNRISNEADW